MIVPNYIFLTQIFPLGFSLTYPSGYLTDIWDIIVKWGMVDFYPPLIPIATVLSIGSNNQPPSYS